MNSKSNIAAGIHAELGNDNQVNFSFTVLEKKKDSLFVKQQQVIKEYNDFKKAGEENLSVFLNINGKGIIHKKITRIGSDTPASLLQKALPNGRPDDFYIQIIPLDETEAFISVIRKVSADDVLKELVRQKVYVVNLSLGPFIVQTLIPLMETGENSLTFGTNQLMLNDKRIAGFSAVPDTGENIMNIGGEKVKSSFLLSYAAAFAAIMNIQEVRSESALVDELSDEWVQRKKLQKNKILVIGGFFILAMVNMLLYNQFSNSQNEINSNLAIVQPLVSGYDSLKKDFERKELFVEQMGLEHSSRHSYFADQLAHEVPASVKLTLLSIQPAVVKTNTRNETEISFLSGIIRVSGICNKSTELNDWIKAIKVYSWVKDVSLKTYAREKSMQSGEFNIEIMLNG